MKCSFGNSNFLGESANLSPSIVSLYFFALTAEDSLPRRRQSRRTCTHPLPRELQNYSLLLNGQLENAGSHQKKIPLIQGQRRSPSKMVREVKSCLESNLLSTRDTQRAQTNLLHTRTQRSHRDWERTVFECLLWRHRSAVDCCKSRGSGCSRPGCGIRPLGGRRH